MKKLMVIDLLRRLVEKDISLYRSSLCMVIERDNYIKILILTEDPGVHDIQDQIVNQINNILSHNNCIFTIQREVGLSDGIFGYNELEYDNITYSLTLNNMNINEISLYITKDEYNKIETILNQKANL